MGVRPKVVCIADVRRLALPSACAYIRVILPFSDPMVRDVFDVSYADAENYRGLAPDVFVVQRLAFADLSAADDFLRARRKVGAKLVYEIDDDLLGIDASHTEFDHYQTAGAVVRRFLLEADEVWVSTRELADRYQKLGARVIVLQNELDPRIWQLSPQVADDRFRILHMGTSTHRPDFESIVAPVLEKLTREFGQLVEADVVGVTNESGKSWRVVTPHPSIAGSYPAFSTWLQTRFTPDVGVAPLTDTLFNQAKSHIKWLEYAGIGALTVATPTGEYAGSIKNGVTGMLAAPTQDAFYDTLRELILDRQLTRRIRQQARLDLSNRLEHRPVAHMRVRRLVELGGIGSSRAAQQMDARSSDERVLH